MRQSGNSSVQKNYLVLASVERKTFIWVLDLDEDIRVLLMPGTRTNISNIIIIIFIQEF
jgi:hypothetical protein